MNSVKKSNLSQEDLNNLFDNNSYSTQCDNIAEENRRMKGIYERRGIQPGGFLNWIRSWL
jgi:hypothetical protein